MRAHLRALLSCVAIAVFGCDSDVSIPGSGGSGGSGGEPSSTATTVGGAGGSASCQSSASCDFSSWCDFPTDSCGGEGVCVAIPTECPADCDGVCSCDGTFYCNDCLAHKAGVDVDALGDCAAPDIEYSVYSLPTDVPRLVLFKADFVRDLCIQVRVAGLGGAGTFAVEVTPSEWQIEDITASDSVTDCVLGNDGVPITPQGKSAGAFAAEGTLALTLPVYPCTVSSDMTLQFVPGFGWVDELESFQWEYASSQIPCDP